MLAGYYGCRLGTRWMGRTGDRRGSAAGREWQGEALYSKRHTGAAGCAAPGDTRQVGAQATAGRSGRLVRGKTTGDRRAGEREARQRGLA